LKASQLQSNLSSDSSSRSERGLAPAPVYDLIKLRQDAPAETKSEVARRVAEVFNTFHSRVDVSNDEILVGGELAVTRGSFRVTLTPKSGGEPQTIDRRYLELWRKENGCWLVVRTMDNVG
jgi:ketosteroid isomerase-like protein